MPGKDGFDAITEILRHSPEAKIVAMSGHAEHRGVNTMTWAKNLGARVCLRKPFMLKDLIAAVQTALYGDDQPLHAVA